MNRRLHNELCDIQNSDLKLLHDLQVNESDILLWEGILYPENPPYNKGGFRIQISFPSDYPFKPPSILFKTQIYHPNIDDNGQVCLGAISVDNWKPATTIRNVLSKLIELINEPEPAHPLRAELAEEFQKNKKKFLKNAEEHTKKFAEKRPSCE